MAAGFVPLVAGSRTIAYWTYLFQLVPKETEDTRGASEPVPRRLIAEEVVHVGQRLLQH